MCDSVRLLFFFFFLLTWPRTHDDRTGRVFPDHLITYQRQSGGVDWTVCCAPLHPG